MFSTADNRVQLIGFLGTEIIIEETKDNQVARMSMTTQETRKTPNGKETIAVWHNLVAWGKTAEVMAKMFSKGQRIFIEGKLCYREHTSPGTLIRRTIAEILVTDFKKLESKDV